MKCFWCNTDFEEKDIQESHDIPCYLFEGNRKGQKNQADKFGRHWLCKKCHKKYETSLRLFLQKKAKEFSNDYFQPKEDDYGDTKTITN